MRLLSDAIEYGLRAVVWLAQHPGQSQKVREIAEGTHSTPGYLVKVLQVLTKGGILSAQRGSSGGFRLVHDPAALSVLDVINSIDPIERIHTCPLSHKTDGGSLCPMHKCIDDAIAKLERSFGELTIEDLINESKNSNARCEVLRGTCPQVN